jgi:uncharacterized protein YegP (UPF0339 family)
MHVEVYHRAGFWARITGAEGWRWRLVAPRGHVLMAPRETFASRQACLAALALLQIGLTSTVDSTGDPPERAGRGPLTGSRPFNAMTATPGGAGHAHTAGIE